VFRNVAGRRSDQATRETPLGESGVEPRSWDVAADEARVMAVVTEAEAKVLACRIRPHVREALCLLGWGRGGSLVGRDDPPIEGAWSVRRVSAMTGLEPDYLYQIRCRALRRRNRFLREMDEDLGRWAEGRGPRS
jgi:hypothetical protein